MNESPARTTNEEIKQLVYFFQFFRPNELAFLIDIHGRWSRFDPNRLDKITSLLHRTFHSDQSLSLIQQTIIYFTHNSSLNFTCKVPIDRILREAGESHHLNPYRDDCPLCGLRLDPDHSKIKRVKMYCVKGELTEGAVISVACHHSRTDYSKEAPTYVYPNFFRRNKLDVWTEESINNGEYLYIGAKHAYERALLEGYTCQLMGSPNSWNKVVDGWNLEAFNSGTNKKRKNWQLRLSFAFIKYKIVQFDLCVGTLMVSVPCTVRGFDEWAWNTFPHRLTAYIYLWNNHKTLIGPCGTDCSRCLIIDGHQKCRRRVCRAKQIEVTTEEFSSLKIGCCRTPKRGSYHCEIHRHEHSSEDTPSLSVERRKKAFVSRIQRRLNWRKGRHDSLGATNCRTQKARSDDYVQRCSRSFGVVAGVTNCKVIVTFSELFRSETLREIVSLLCSTIRASNNVFPVTAVYDDGCHLVEFVRNHFGKDLAVTSASTILQATPFSIDRVHFKNHVGVWCRKNMNPDDNRLLDGVNTEAAEQCFSWLKGYASILSCLGWRRSPLFLLILFHNKNLERTNVRPTRVFHISNEIPSNVDVSLAHCADAKLVAKQIKNDLPNDHTEKPNDQSRRSNQSSIIEIVPRSPEKDSSPTVESVASSDLSTDIGTTTISVAAPQSTLRNNKWKILAKDIGLRTDLKRKANEKRHLRNAKRSKI